MRPFSAILIATGFVQLVQSLLLHPTYFVNRNIKLKQHGIYMSAKTLDNVQAKISGRADLLCMVDCEEDELLKECFAMTNHKFEPPPTVGDIVTGSVIDVDENGALLSIPGKLSGFIPLAEAALLPVKRMSEVVKVGETISALMIGTLKGMPVISLRYAQLVKAWEDVSKTRVADDVFEVKVVEVNKGGAVCSAFGGLKAFLPGSHYVGTPDPSLVGTTVKVKVLDAAEEEGRLVVSQRLALSATGPSLVRGSLVAGTVTGLRPYGVFLELEGGHAGLLHISQISADRIKDVADFFSVGERVPAVAVLEHDQATGRVALSTKILECSPGDMLRNKHEVFQNAEHTLQVYHERIKSERAEREAKMAAMEEKLLLNGSVITSTNGSASAIVDGSQRGAVAAAPAVKEETAARKWNGRSLGGAVAAAGAIENVIRVKTPYTSRGDRPCTPSPIVSSLSHSISSTDTTCVVSTASTDAHTAISYTSGNADDSCGGGIVKAGRGRPRKNSTALTKTTTSATAAATTPPTPPTSTVDVAGGSPVEKAAARGRPRKQSSSSSSSITPTAFAVDIDSSSDDAKRTVDVAVMSSSQASSSEDPSAALAAVAAAGTLRRERGRGRPRRSNTDASSRSDSDLDPASTTTDVNSSLAAAGESINDNIV